MGAGMSTGGGGSLGANAGGGAPGTAGIQLGNLGGGLGDPQGLGGAASGGSANIQQGAFGGGNAQGPTSIVLPGLRIAADVTNNSLVIYASQENFRLIEHTLAQLDQPATAVRGYRVRPSRRSRLIMICNSASNIICRAAGSKIRFDRETTSAAASTTTAAGTPTVSQVLGAVLPGGNLLLRGLKQSMGRHQCIAYRHRRKGLVVAIGGDAR